MKLRSDARRFGRPEPQPWGFARRRSALLLGSGLAMAATWMASCATVELGDGEVSVEPSAVPPPNDSGAVDVAPPPPDGGCDASDPTCVTQEITCDVAAFCPVPTGVNAFYTLTAIWGSSKNDVWVGGSGGTIIHWDGSSWKPTPAPVKNTFHVIWGSGPNDVWALSTLNVMFRSDGFVAGSASWELVPNPTGDEYNSAPVYAAWGDATEMRIGTRMFNLFEPNGDFGPGNQLARRIVDGGAEWFGTSGTATVTGLWGASRDDLWLIGDNSATIDWQRGLTMHGTRGANGELQWVEVDSQSAAVLRGIWGSSAADVWAVGDRGTIRHIGAGSTRWEIVASPTKETLHAVWGSGPNDVWAVGENGAILHWDGAAWTVAEAAFAVNRKRPHLYGVWGSGPADVWIVGDGVALHGGVK